MDYRFRGVTTEDEAMMDGDGILKVGGCVYLEHLDAFVTVTQVNVWISPTDKVQGEVEAVYKQNGKEKQVTLNLRYLCTELRRLSKGE